MAVPLGAIVKHKDGYYADPVPGGGAVFGMYNVDGGYARQIEKSEKLGQQGFNMLAANYGQMTADADATRSRNMARIDQYGKSLRSDLDIKNKQALAAASQSAIKRGLGNMTIQDSLVRGQNFDNNRQMMSLEDQLLKNQISTDADLSKTYQSALQARAQALASQWNTNIQNDNSLVGSSLGYQQSMQEMFNQNQQRELDRQMTRQNQYRPTSVQYNNLPQYGSFGPAQPRFQLSSRSMDTF
jgi:hypothetical protein